MALPLATNACSFLIFFFLCLSSYHFLSCDISPCSLCTSNDILSLNEHKVLCDQLLSFRISSHNYYYVQAVTLEKPQGGSYSYFGTDHNGNQRCFVRYFMEDLHGQWKGIRISGVLKESSSPLVYIELNHTCSYTSDFEIDI